MGLFSFKKAKKSMFLESSLIYIIVSRLLD